jgi:hypothetical protein
MPGCTGGPERGRRLETEQLRAVSQKTVRISSLRAAVREQQLHHPAVRDDVREVLQLAEVAAV